MPNSKNPVIIRKELSNQASKLGTTVAAHETVFEQFRSSIEEAFTAAEQKVVDAKESNAEIQTSLIREYTNLSTLKKLMRPGQDYFMEYVDFCACIKDREDYFEKDHSALYSNLLGDEDPNIRESVSIAFRDARRDFLKLAYPEQRKAVRSGVTRRALIQGAGGGLLVGLAGGGTVGATADSFTVKEGMGIGGTVGTAGGYIVVNNHLVKTEVLELYTELLNGTSNDRQVEKLSLGDLLDITSEIHAAYDKELSQTKSAER